MKESIHFDHVRLHPSQQIGLHQQPTWELSMIVEGNGMRTIGKTTEPFNKGEVVLVPPETLHQWQFDANDEWIENITITFSQELIETVAATFPELRTLFLQLAETSEAIKFSGSTLSALKDGLKQMCHQTKAERFVTMLRVMVLIAETKERYAIGRRTYETEAEQRLKQIEIFISCNYKREVSIADIAQHIGMNRSSLCTFYHRQTGKTLVAALTEHRLSVAQHLLRHSSLTIQQVCYECGFNDVPHFCRMFKRMFQITPKEFRKQE